MTLDADTNTLRHRGHACPPPPMSAGVGEDSMSTTRLLALSSALSSDDANRCADASLRCGCAFTRTGCHGAGGGDVSATLLSKGEPCTTGGNVFASETLPSCFDPPRSNMSNVVATEAGANGGAYSGVVGQRRHVVRPPCARGLKKVHEDARHKTHCSSTSPQGSNLQAPPS